MKNLESGYVILLNGVSSSGKSTIINEIYRLNPNFKVLKIDDWFPSIFIKKAESLGWGKESNISPWFYLHDYLFRTTNKYYFDTEVRNILFSELREFYQQAKNFALDGYDIIIDTVLESEKEHSAFDDFFKEYNHHLKVLVYCPMDILTERVEKRNQLGIPEEYRNLFLSFEQFLSIFKVRENKDESIVDIVKSKILLQALEKAIRQLIINKIPEGYLPKLEEFKVEFIKQFQLNTKEEIILVARNKYNLILNTAKNSAEESARQIIKLVL